MKKTTLNFIVAAGLILGTAALFGQTPSDVITENPVHLTEKNTGSGIEGTWKLHTIDGQTIEYDLTKTFAPGGVLIGRQGRATKKTKWKMENGKLCVNEVGSDFSCCEYKVTKTTLTYTIKGVVLGFIRK